MARRALALVLVLAACGLPALAGAPADSHEAKVWKPLMQLEHPTAEWNGLSGPLLAADGDDLVLLAAADGAFTLVAYRQGAPGTWQQAAAQEYRWPTGDPLTPRRWDGDGTLALEGGVALLAAPGADGQVGMAERVELRPSMASSHFRFNESDDGFGHGGAFEGSLFAVGATGGPDGSRSQVILGRHGGGGLWTMAGALPEPDGGPAGGFGSSLAMDGGWLAVGDPGEAGSGKVTLYRDEADGFVLRRQLSSPSPGPGQGFGTLLHMDGANLAVMEPRHGGPEAIVYLFRDSGANWTFESRVAVPRPEGAGTVILDLDGDRLIAGTSDGRHASEVRIWERTAAGWGLVQEAPVSLLAAAPHDLALLPNGWAAVSEPSQGRLVVDIFGLAPVPLSECPGCLGNRTGERVLPAANATTPSPQLPTPSLPSLQVPECAARVAGLSGCLPVDLDLQARVPITLPLPEQVSLTYTTEVATKLVGQALVAVDPAALAQQVPVLPEAQVYIEVDTAAGPRLPAGSEVTIEARADDPSDAEDLALHYWNGARWVDLTTVPAGATVPGEAGGEPLQVFGTGFDPATGAVWAKVEHTSVYALGPRTQPAGLPWALIVAVSGAMLAVAAFAASAGLALRRK